jgi:16S rRNA (cytosine967-C5)-methyltransferase
VKIYKNLVEGVVQSLEKIFNEGRYTDRVIEFLFKDQKKWGARDRRFVAETTYDIVRNYRLLQELSGNSTDFYKLIGVYLILHDSDLPAWEEFKDIDKKSVEQKWNEAKNIRAVFQSVPDWLDELGQAELGNKWGKELAALNEQAPVVLRANTLKGNAKSLKTKLNEEGTETVLLPEYGEALVLKERKNIFTSPLFKNGYFEIQDASSQLVAKFLEPAPGMFVVDACAGAGGKALHVAALMQNKGKLIALDVEERKLEELKRRAQRASVTTIDAKVIISEKTIKDLEGKADRLLLDVPCSGLGVLKRNPDAKWKLSLKGIEEVKEKQKNILQNYSRILKPGGLMVYATCSILPSENQKQVEAFISENKNFAFVKEKTIYPSEGFDGFYMCLMKRTN